MDSCPNSPSSSQPDQNDNLLSNETEMLYISISCKQLLLDEIEKINHLSSNISLLQLDQVYALIRAG